MRVESAVKNKPTARTLNRLASACVPVVATVTQLNTMGRVGRPPKKVVSRNNSEDSDSGSDSSNEFPRSQRSTAPTWLLQEKQTQKFYSVPIPVVPDALKNVIEEHLIQIGAVDSNSDKQSTKMLHHMRQLQQDLQSQRQKVKVQEAKLETAISAKDQKLSNLRRDKEGELEKVLKEVERKIRKKQDKRSKEAEEKIRQQIIEKFEKEYKEEQTLKRKQKEEEENKGEAATEEEGEESEAKKQKVETRLRSDSIQEKIDEKKARVEELTNMKTEMIWLMKQVIKAETKQKLKLKKAD